MPTDKAWNELVEQIRTEHNGVFGVELFLGHDGNNVCRFKDYCRVLAEGDSGRSVQEAVERCIAAWKLESGAAWFAKNRYRYIRLIKPKRGKMMGFRTSFRSFFVAVLSPLGYKVNNGTGQRVNADLPLTTNPLLSKGESWLHTRISNASPVQATTASLKSKGRSFRWSRLTKTPVQFSSCSRTIPFSDSTLIPVTLYSLSCQTGTKGTGNPSNNGDQFTAQFPWSNGHSALARPNHEPACNGRVLSFVVGGVR